MKSIACFIVFIVSHFSLSNAQPQTEFGVSGCYCRPGASFECSTPLTTITQDSIVYLCLKPTLISGPPEDLLSAEITNFSMELAGADGVVYQPVELGTDTWEVDELTEVTVGTSNVGIQTVKVSVFLVVNLFNIIEPGDATLVTIAGEAVIESPVMINMATFSLDEGEYDGFLIVETNNQNDQANDIANNYSVGACYCRPGASYDCSEPDFFNQDSIAPICLYPIEFGVGTPDVRISNFDMTLTGYDGVFLYEPVELGTETWIADALTDVTVGTSSNGVPTVKVNVFLVSPLFNGLDDGDTFEIDISGETVLEFTNAKTDTTEIEAPYNLIIEGTAEMGEGKGGCFSKIKSFFGKV